MILIADSGSTKTDWCVVLNDTPINESERKGSTLSSNRKKKFNRS